MENNPKNNQLLNTTTGRYLGILDGYFLFADKPEWVYSYCKSCWINEIKKILPKIGINVNQNSDNNKDNNNEQIKNLQKELNETKKKIEQKDLIINDLKSKLNFSNNNVNSYKKIIEQKEIELNNVKLELNSNNKANDFLFPNNVNRKEIMVVNFISTDNKLHYAIACTSNNTFAEVEEKLYQQFPEYQETNNNFLGHGQSVLRFKTISQNKIGDGFPVTLVVPL